MPFRKYQKKTAFPFLDHGKDVAVFYSLVIISSYLLAGIFYPSMVELETNQIFFHQTFLVETGILLKKPFHWIDYYVNEVLV